MNDEFLSFHQRFHGFGGELALFIEAGQQGGDRLSFVSENKIVIAGFAFFGMQIKAAPVRLVRFFRIHGIMQITVAGKVRHQVGEFAGVIVFLIVAVLQDPDAKSEFLIGIRVEFDSLIQFKNAANIGK